MILDLYLVLQSFMIVSLCSIPKKDDETEKPCCRRF